MDEFLGSAEKVPGMKKYPRYFTRYFFKFSFLIYVVFPLADMPVLPTFVLMSTYLTLSFSFPLQTKKGVIVLSHHYPLYSMREES